MFEIPDYPRSVCGWLILTCCFGAIGAQATLAEERGHPRLLIGPGQVASLRFQCGIDLRDSSSDTRAYDSTAGTQTELLNQLKAVGAEIMLGPARSDDLWVPAILHLITGKAGEADSYSDYVVRELLSPSRRRLEFDAIVALDYCWDVIGSEERDQMVNRLVDAMEPFETSDAPFSYYRFQRKLCSLAGAIVIDDPQLSEVNAKHAMQVKRVLEAAEIYFKGPFVRFCRDRGVMPTSGGNGGWEEASLVLAVEIRGSQTGQSLWPVLKDNLGRAMEHYFYADTGCEALNHGFIHDDGSTIPVRPGQIYRGFLPAVPWVIARRCDDPVAAWYANRSLPVTGQMENFDRDRYLWVRCLYGPADFAEAARRACPLARQFGGGWVAMRSGWDNGDTLLLFDVGQPFWRGRQHYDAGQFQIHRKNRLAIDSGDDVTFEAVPAKGGQAMIGGERDDWERYFQATIAHNCVTVADRVLDMDTFRGAWPAMGNQRTQVGDYDLTADGIETTDRRTGLLTAFETNAGYSYATVDLSAAYPSSTVKSMERRLLFMHGGAILVLDRLTAMKLRSLKTWHLQLPVRPELVASIRSGRSSQGEGAGRDMRPYDLSQVRQIHGVDHHAGIWEADRDMDWLLVTHGEGRLFVKTLMPSDARRRVVGGPMHSRRIFGGPLAEMLYCGGDLLGYENRLWPASIPRAPNASYSLGSPTSLGPNFGVGQTWGRLDVFPPEDVDCMNFLHLLIPTDAKTAWPPAMRFEVKEEVAMIDLRLGKQDSHIELKLGAEPGGRVVIQDSLIKKVIFDKALATTVEPNLPIPR